MADIKLVAGSDTCLRDEGERGPRGEHGERGPEGPRGHHGATGPRGPTGPTGLATFATHVVFRPGDPLGTHDNVFVTWPEAFAALQSVTGRGQVFLEFDDNFSSPCHIPFGAWVLDWNNVIWTNKSKGSIATVVELDDGASIQSTAIGPTLTIAGNALLIVSNRTGSVAPFDGINLVLEGVRTRLANTSAFALPMVVTGGVGAFIAIAGSNNFGGVGNGAACPAPVIDCEGGSVLVGGGAGFVCDNAFTDSVGGGDVFVRLMDDGFNGGSTPGQNYLFPAAAGIVTLGVESRDRHLVQGVVTTTPYAATYNELVRVDTSAIVITVNAPSASPAAGERLVVKDITGNAALQPIAVAPLGLDVVEDPVIAVNFQCKTWVSDGAGTWMLVATSP